MSTKIKDLYMKTQNTAERNERNLSKEPERERESQGVRAPRFNPTWFPALFLKVLEHYLRGSEGLRHQRIKPKKSQEKVRGGSEEGERRVGRVRRGSRRIRGAPYQSSYRVLLGVAPKPSEYHLGATVPPK